MAEAPAIWFRMKRVSPGLLLIVFFAILIGLAGAYAIKRALTPPIVPPVAKEKNIMVVVAAIDLPPGRLIQGGDIMNLPLTPKQYAARKWPGVIMNSARQIVGRILKEPIKKGTAFEPDSFYVEGTGPDISGRLAEGFRAVTITVPTEGLPSKAAPGALVDIVFRAKATKDKDFPIPEVTRLLLQGVEILAIGENATPGLQGGIDRKIDHHPVTLAVSPEQATALKTAEGHGDLSLTLRRPSDQGDEGETNSLTLRELLELPKPTPAPPPFVAEIFRNGQRHTVKFGATGPIDDPSAAKSNGVAPTVAPSNTPTLTPDTNDPASALPPDRSNYRDSSPPVPDNSEDRTGDSSSVHSSTDQPATLRQPPAPARPKVDAGRRPPVRPRSAQSIAAMPLST
jgi:Flp pilus assembly protein CpaB